MGTAVHTNIIVGPGFPRGCHAITPFQPGLSGGHDRPLYGGLETTFICRFHRVVP